MKHAGPAALAGLAGLIAQIRERPGLVEKKPGVFYRKGQAFLHFHEDPDGMFVDLRDGADWLRLHLPDDASWPNFLAALDRSLSGLK
jgi:hypothetical protein